MPSAGELKARIQSVRETKKVTDAMYMISSVKMRRAKKEVKNTEPYFHALQGQITDLLRYIPDTQNRYFHTELGGRVHASRALVVITSDKGLAGSYNHAVIKETEAYMSRHPETLLFVVGEYGRQYFMNKKARIAEDFYYSADLPTVWEARRMCMQLLAYFHEDGVDEIDVIYTAHQNGRPGDCRRSCLLPLDRSTFKKDDGKREDSFKEFFPSAESVLAEIVPSYLVGFIYSFLVDSYCSEQEARMSAMSQAGTNAEEMLKSMKSEYNSIRQAAITREMIEISSGAKALRAKKARKEVKHESN